MKNFKKEKNIFLLHKLRPFPRLLWAELSCTGGFSTIQAPVLAETHTQEGAGQGKRKRRRRRRRCKSPRFLFTFFRNGLLEGCRGPQVIELTAEGKATKDKTKNNSTGKLPKKERLKLRGQWKWNKLKIKKRKKERKQPTKATLRRPWLCAVRPVPWTSAARNQPGIGQSIAPGQLNDTRNRTQKDFQFLGGPVGKTGCWQNLVFVLHWETIQAESFHTPEGPLRCNLSACRLSRDH